MKRRDFLQVLMLAPVQPRLTDEIARHLMNPSSAASYSPKPSGKEKGSVFLFMKEWKGPKSALRVVDWDTYEWFDVPLPLTLPHAIVQDPRDPNVVVVFETFGSIARVDLRSKKVILLDHREGKDMSYGHAALAGPEALFSAEVEPRENRGIVRVRDLKTLAPIRTLPKECDGSHQVSLMPGGKLAACGVATDFGRGREGAVTFVDVATHEVRSRVALPSSISHVIPISSDEVIALGLRMTASPIAPKYGTTSDQNMPDSSRTATFEAAPIFKVKTDGTHEELSMEGHAEIFKFNFAFLDVPKADMCVSTHLGSHRMIVWKKRRPVKVFDMPYPTNLVLSGDGEEFMVVSDNKARIFSVADLSEVKTIRDELRVVGLSAYKTVKT